MLDPNSRSIFLDIYPVTIPLARTTPDQGYRLDTVERMVEDYGVMSTDQAASARIVAGVVFAEDAVEVRDRHEHIPFKYLQGFLGRTLNFEDRTPEIRFEDTIIRPSVLDDDRHFSGHPIKDYFTIPIDETADYKKPTKDSYQPFQKIETKDTRFGGRIE